MKKYRPPTKEEMIKRNLLAIKDWQIDCKGSPIQDLYWWGVPRTERHSISRSEIARQRAEAIKADAAEKKAAAAAKAKAEAEAKAKAELEAAINKLFQRSKSVMDEAEMLSLTAFLDEPLRSALRSSWGKAPITKCVQASPLGYRTFRYTFCGNLYIDKRIDDAYPITSIDLFIADEKVEDEDERIARSLLRSKPLKTKED